MTKSRAAESVRLPPPHALDVARLPPWTESYLIDLTSRVGNGGHFLLKAPTGVVAILMSYAGYTKLYSAAHSVLDHRPKQFLSEDWSKSVILATELLLPELAHPLFEYLSALDEPGVYFVVATKDNGAFVLVPRAEYELLCAAASLAADPERYKALVDYVDNGRTLDKVF